MDPRFQRTYDHAQGHDELGQISNQYRRDDGNPAGSVTYGVAPQGHHPIQRAPYHGLDSNPFRQTVPSRLEQEYGVHNPLTFDALRNNAYQTSASAATPRVSLGIPNMYSQPETRASTNVDNHFKILRNLKNGTPFQGPGPQIHTASYNRMVQPSSNPLSMPLPLQRNDPVSPFSDRPQPRIFGQLQPQNYQAVPSPSDYAIMSPRSDPPSTHTDPASLYQQSSPLAKINERRSASRSQPSSSSLGYERTVKRSKEAPRTPQRQTIPSIVPQTLHTKSKTHTPPVTHGIQLVPLQALPDRLRIIFPYDLFNAVQSKCFDPVYNTDDNVVVSAPTGSGKTAILELAICRLISSHSNSGQFKIVYQAPIKSLCSERMRDWQKKFKSMNLECAELTGDTSASEMSKVRDASIIVTTPEKWDSITRKWKDHVKLLQLVKLFLIDEVHILNDPRGATLEAVVSRMKTIGANVRFVAMSATVPNSEDVAMWLGKDHTNNHLPAYRQTFGEEFRPVQLQKFVHGYETKPNDFIFDNALAKRLPNLIAKYSHNKPIIIFCFTKSSCEKTAALLADWWSSLSGSQRLWLAPVEPVRVLHKDLQTSVPCGVAFHHAGLDPQDRHAVETAFLEGNISVICCTSTLAVGVNLPCHLVILKGTTCYKETGPSEYSDLEVMQMLGRAGRPQFDDSGVAVIMTRHEHVDRYTKMISGQEMLESKLHLNLIGHLNSEIGLGTVRDISTAKKWLTGTFLSVRMRQNPQYYKIDGIASGRDPDERLERVCERDINLLQECKLITNGERFTTTEYGDAMSRYMVPFDTMKLLLNIPRNAKVEEILHTLCQAADFKDLKMRANERTHLRALNKSCFMKFPVKENISTTAHKVFIAIQVQLGGIDLPSNDDFTQTTKRQFVSDKTIIFERIQRLVRCVVDCKSYECDAIATRNALDLARAISAGFWENSTLQLRQIPQIGPVAMRKLASNNIKTVEELASLDPAGIERVIGRNPPFGRKLQQVVVKFPRLTLEGEVTGRAPSKAEEPVKINVVVKLGLFSEDIPVWKARMPGLTFIAETSDGSLVHFWRGNVKSLQKGFQLGFMVELLDADSKILCQLACDEIVGTVRSLILHHEIPASAFPPPRPNSTFKPQQREASVLPQSQNEFDQDSFEDNELLAAVEDAERTAGYEDEQGFQDIDEVVIVTHTESKKHKPEVLQKLQPARMQNGKFECNHACRAGHSLKNGKACKHRCCHEGLDKPRKVRSRKSSVHQDNGKEIAVKGPKNDTTTASQNLKAAKYSNKFDKNVEYVDLEKEESPLPDIAAYGGQKPHDLRTGVHKHQTILPGMRNPKVEYGGLKDPFDHSNEGKFEMRNTSKRPDPFEDNSFMDDESLPSPTKLLSLSGDHDDVVNWGYQGAERDEGSIFESPGLPSQYDTSQDEELEIAMVGLDDSLILQAQKEGTPNLSTSFAESIFDFSSCLPPQKSSELSPSPRESLKRGAGDSSRDSEPEVKRYRVTEDSPPTEEKNAIPAWVGDGVDADLFEEFGGIVDFVD